MPDLPPPEPTSDPRVYFAAERTFLAWLRTGLGLMGVGFAVARFALFLRRLEPQAVNLNQHTPGLSLWAGVALVALGVLLILSSLATHIRTVRQLREGSWIPGRVSSTAIALGILLALIGVGIAAYLIFLR